MQYSLSKKRISLSEIKFVTYVLHINAIAIILLLTLFYGYEDLVVYFFHPPLSTRRDRKRERKVNTIFSEVISASLSTG